MKLYYVDHFEYEYSRSLLPPKDPEPKEESLVEAGLVSPSGAELVALFIKLGYTPYQAEHLYRAVFNHYWYDYGLHAVYKCNSMIYYWQKSYLAPAWQQTQVNPAPLLSAPVIIFGTILAAIIVGLVIKGPDVEKDYWWYPPCDLDLGTYKEQLWWIALVAVSGKQKPMYAMTGYEGNVITAYSYKEGGPSVWRDCISFWGTMDFRCWKIPYFRSYRLQNAICYYVGPLESAGGMYFYLKPPAVDEFAPKGPITIPKKDWCRAYSPCHV